MELLTLENAARAGGAPMSRIGSSDPGCRGEDPINLEPDPRAAPFASMANSRTMSPPTRADTPHLGAGSRYGPTPAADGRADRPPPAGAPPQEHQSPTAPAPVDTPPPLPPARAAPRAARASPRAPPPLAAPPTARRPPPRGGGGVGCPLPGRSIRIPK